MKLLIAFALLIASISAMAAKPFSNALIFPGGGFKAGVHLASYHAMLDAGIKPDLLIGTCGGSITAAIIEKFPDDPKKQLEFLLSNEVHDLLSKIKSTKYGKILKLLNIKRQSKRNSKKNWYSKFDEKYILDVPQDLELFGNGPFSPKGEGKSFATIIQSVEFNDDPSLLGSRKRKSSGKHFQQVYFTDSKTAELLDGMTSKVSELYPESGVALTTKTMPEIGIDQAVRSGISDPYLMKPGVIDGKYYLTGAIDVLPIETTNKLAENTWYFFRNNMGDDLDQFFKEVFGFKMMDKVRYTQKEEHLLVNDEDIPVKAHLNPEFKLPSGIRFKMQNYDTYRDLMLTQYNNSYAIVKKALAEAKAKNLHGSQKVLE